MDQDTHNRLRALAKQFRTNPTNIVRTLSHADDCVIIECSQFRAIAEDRSNTTGAKLVDERVS